MATKAQQRRLAQRGELEKQVLQIVQSLGRRHGVPRVWADLMEISAIALARLDRQQFDEREKRYLQVIRAYSREELAQLVEAFGLIVATYERNWPFGGGDVLGQIYMGLDLGNANTGQFFTPFEVSQLMAAMTMVGAEKIIAEQGFVRLCEPAVGAGGMVLAAAGALHSQEINYQQCMHVVAIDIDIRCVHMAFIQMSLAHIPAVVVHGNALSNEQHGRWYTPAHIIGGWAAKLHAHQGSTVRADKELSERLDVVDLAGTTGVKADMLAKGQMSLF